MTLRARRGVALAVALFALVTVAALVHAIMTPAIALRRAAVRAGTHAATESLAERAIGDAMASADAQAWREMAIGSERLRSIAAPSDLPHVLPGASSGEVRVRRVAESIWFVEALASVQTATVPVTARRTLFLELRPDTARPASALTAGGTVTLGAADDLSRDSACGTSTDSSALLKIAPWTDLHWPRSGAASLVSRDSSAAGAGAYAHPAGVDGARYRSAAAIRLVDGAVVAPEPRQNDGTCVAGDVNWGEPRREPIGTVAACVDARPIVHAVGDLRIAGGRGQGILFVDGRLEIDGPFRYDGIIVASGGVSVSGGAVTVVGAVYTGPAAPATFRADRTTVIASRCAVQAALDAAATIAPLKAWAWGR